MIISEENKKKEEREEKKKIFKMLEDVKLPKGYEFIDDCILLVKKGFWASSTIAELSLKDDEVIEVCFNDERDLNGLRKGFEESKTKFKFRLEVDIGNYY